MIQRIRNHPARTAVVAAVLIGGLAWLAFGFFAVHTLFIDERVAEPPPVFDAVADPVEPSIPSPTPDPTTPDPTTPPAAPDPATPDPAAPDPTTPPAAPVQPVTEPVIERAGSFESEAHTTRGQALVLGNGTSQRFLRFQDFETDNGPDLNVYLVSSADPSAIVDLGDLAGNIGDQNYEIPAGVDLDRYDRVVVWCVRFGVAFGSADLTVPA